MKQPMQVKIGDKSHTIEEWSKITGIAYNTLYKRYIAGAKADEILKPIRKREIRK